MNSLESLWERMDLEFFLGNNTRCLECGEEFLAHEDGCPHCGVGARTRPVREPLDYDDCKKADGENWWCAVVDEVGELHIIGYGEFSPWPREEAVS